MNDIDRFPSSIPLPDFTETEMHAIDEAAIRAHSREKNLGRFITPDWQAEGARIRGVPSWDPAAVIRSRVYEYAYTHPQEVRGVDPWKIKADLAEWAEKQMWRARKARLHQGRPVYVTPLGIGADFDARIVKLGQPRDAKFRGVKPRHVEALPAFPNNQDEPTLNVDHGRSARKIPKAVRDEARTLFATPPRRPTSWPSDPTGEQATNAVYVDQQRAYFGRGRLPHGPNGKESAVAKKHAGTALLEAASIPKAPEHHRQASPVEFWDDVLDGAGRRSWEGVVRRATGLSPATVKVYAPTVAPTVSRALPGATRGLDKRAFDAAVPVVVRQVTTTVLTASFEAICTAPCCTRI